MANSTRTPIPPPLPVGVESLARRFRLPIADLSTASAQAVSLVPERWARRFHVVPLTATSGELLIATSDPLDIDCERTLAFATGRHVRLSLADPDEISARIEELYGGDGSRQLELVADVQHLDNRDESAPPTNADEEGASSVSALVDELIAGGIAARASDIHIEPEEQGIAVRFAEGRGRSCSRQNSVSSGVRRIP